MEKTVDFSGDTLLSATSNRRLFRELFMRGTMKMWSIAAALLVAVGGFARSAGAAHAAGEKGSVKGKVVKVDGMPVSGVEVRLMARPERQAKAAKNQADPAAPGEKAAPAKRPAREI